MNSFHSLFHSLYPLQLFRNIIPWNTKTSSLHYHCKHTSMHSLSPIVCSFFAASKHTNPSWIRFSLDKPFSSPLLLCVLASLQGGLSVHVSVRPSICISEKQQFEPTKRWRILINYGTRLRLVMLKNSISPFLALSHKHQQLLVLLPPKSFLFFFLLWSHAWNFLSDISPIPSLPSPSSFSFTQNVMSDLSFLILPIPCFSLICLKRGFLIISTVLDLSPSHFHAFFFTLSPSALFSVASQCVGKSGC